MRRQARNVPRHLHYPTLLLPGDSPGFGLGDRPRVVHSVRASLDFTCRPSPKCGVGDDSVLALGPWTTLVVSLIPFLYRRRLSPVFPTPTMGYIRIASSNALHPPTIFSSAALICRPHLPSTFMSRYQLPFSPMNPHPLLPSPPTPHTLPCWTPSPSPCRIYDCP